MGNTYTKIAETRNEWQRQVKSKRLVFKYFLVRKWNNHNLTIAYLSSGPASFL